MPGPLFVTSTTQVRHAVFAIKRKPPGIFRPAGTGAALVLAQFTWGPAQTLMEATDPKDFTNKIAPPGMDRTTQAYASVNQKGFPDLWWIRVMGTGAVKAFADFPNSGATVIFRVTLNSPGTAGNSVTGTISAASDGDANHVDLTVTVTGSSGTTTDTVKNINFSGVGADGIDGVAGTTFDLSEQSILIGTITKTAAGIAAVGSVTFASGTTPAVTAADYVGTIGTGDKGLAQGEQEGSLRHIFFDDVGNSLRAAANAGMKAHVNALQDRVGYINGNSGQSLATAQSDVANYRSGYGLLMYMDPWVYQLDDFGTKTLIPSACYAACVGSRTSPSTAIAWKDPEVQGMISGISSLEFNRGNGAGTNTQKGIATFIREETGGHTIEADVTTDAPVDTTIAYLTDTRITIHIALTAKTNLRSVVDAPNVPANQQFAINGVTEFMDILKAASTGRDPNHTAHVIDWGMNDLTTENTEASIQAGRFIIPIDVETSVGIRQLFISLQAGAGVRVTPAT